MEDRTCPRCRRELPATAEHFNRDRGDRLGISTYCRSCSKARGKERRARARPEEREATRIYCLSYVKAAHLRCLMAYSDGEPRCACCGETNMAFLTLDHVAGDGALHHRAIVEREGKPAAGYTFYVWLERHGFPPGIQVLCWNCNTAKRTFGACPHQPGGGTKTARIIEAARSGNGPLAGWLAAGRRVL